MFLERKINSKIESDREIKRRGFNTVPLVICERGDLGKIENFITENEAPFYIVRDKAGIVREEGSAKVEKEKILDHVSKLDKFSVEVSSISYAKNRKLFGEIMISSDNSIYFTGTDDKTAAGREYLTKAKWNIETDIFDKKLKEITDMDKIIDYISVNNLFNTVVEFATFDKGVGVKQEEVVVFELRTNY
ncbi:MAG: hypothetical protein WCG91_03710 [Candidatus Shapirobacteria bacterium]